MIFCLNKNFADIKMLIDAFGGEVNAALIVRDWQLATNSPLDKIPSITLLESFKIDINNKPKENRQLALFNKGESKTEKDLKKVLGIRPTMSNLSVAKFAKKLKEYNKLNKTAHSFVSKQQGQSDNYKIELKLKFNNNKDIAFKLKSENEIKNDKQLLVENRNEFRSWLKSTLPGLTLSDKDMVVSASENAVSYWGAIRNFVVYLDKLAPKGTGYHEAFHGVFRNLMTRDEQDSLLIEAIKYYEGPTLAELQDIIDKYLSNKVLERHKNSPHLILAEAERIYYEEKLADDFALFTKTFEYNKKVDEDIAKRNSWQKIQDFFKKLYNKIKGIKNVIKYETYNGFPSSVFNDIVDGKYNNASLDFKDRFEGEITRELKGEINSQPAYKRISGISNSLKVEAIESIKNIYIDKYLKLIKAGVKELSVKDKAEIYNSIIAEFNEVTDTYFELANKGEPTNVTYEQARNLYLITTKFGELVPEVDKALDLLIQNPKGDLISNETETNDDDLYTNIELKAEGNESKGFNEKTTISREKSASVRLKLFLSSIPVLENNKPKINRLGLPIYYDFNKLYAHILENTINLMSLDEQINKLKELSKYRPELLTVIDKLTNKNSTDTTLEFDNIREDFRQAFANQKMDYVVVRYFKNGNSFSYKISFSNREDLQAEIYNNWLNNVTDVTREGIAETATLQNLIDIWEKANDSKITDEIIATLREDLKNKPVIYLGTKKAEELLSNFENIKKDLGNNKEKLKDILYKAGIDLTDDIINKELKTNLADFTSTIFDILNYYGSKDYSKKESSGKKALGKLSKIQFNSEINTSISNFNNVESKSIYPVQMPSFASKFLNKIKSNNGENFINELKRDPILANSNLLEKLSEDLNFRQNKFVFTYLDGLVDEQHNTDGSKFTKMSPSDHLNQQLALFFNNSLSQGSGKTERTAFYEFLTPSDKTMHLISQGPVYNASIKEVNNKKVELLDDSPILDNFFNIIKGETARIKTAIESRDKFLKGDIEVHNLLNHYHFSKNTNVKTLKKEDFNGFAFQYHTFDLSKLTDKIINTIENNPTKSIDEVLIEFKSEIYTEIKQQISKEIDQSIAEAVSKGIITVDNGKIKETTLDITTLNKKIKEGKTKELAVKEMIAEFTANQRINNIELSNLLNGDIAIYKANDLQKRTYQAMSINKQFDSSNSKVKVLVVKDYDTYKSDAVDNLKETVNKKNSTVNLSAYDDINATDAQSFIHPKFNLRLNKMMGRNSIELENIHQLAEQGIESTKSEQILSSVWKPFMFSMQWNPVLNIYTPVQIKTSFTSLYNNFIEDSPLLKEYKQKMEETDTDIIVFESTLKAMLPYRSDFNNLDSNAVIELNLSDLGLQQENPQHIIDEKNSSTRQLKMLFYGSIIPSGDYKGRKGADILKEIDELEAENVNEDNNEVTEAFEKKDDNLVKMIKESVTKRSSTENLEKSLTIEGNEFKYPLVSNISRNIQNMISSIFTSRVIKQKFKGGSAVQASSIGFKYKNLQEQQQNLTKDELKIQSGLKYIEIKDGKLTHVECALPAWTKEFFDSNGKLIDANNIPNELRELLIYRIPTEGLHSMLAVRVVKFLPSSAGNIILLPYEITAQFGADFDFDKMFFLAPEMEYNKETKQLEIIKYSENNNSKKSRNNQILKNYLDILTSIESLPHILKPSGFDIWKELAKEIKDLNKQPKYNFFSGLEQRRLKNLNHTARDLKGQASLHVTGHSISVAMGLRTLANIEGKNVDEFKIGFNNNKSNNFSKISDKDGNLIADKIASLLALVLDDVKDPKTPTLNINSDTIDIICTILRAGFTEKEVIDFVTQPSIVKLAKEMQNNRSQIKDLNYERVTVDTELKKYYELQKSLNELLNDDNYVKEIGGISEYNLLEEELTFARKNAGKFNFKTDINKLSKSELKEYMYITKVQIESLKAFNRIKVISDELVSMNTLFQVNNETSPTLEENLDKVYILEQLNKGLIFENFDLSKIKSLEAYMEVTKNNIKIQSKEFTNSTSDVQSIKLRLINSQIKSNADGNYLIRKFKPEIRDLITNFTMSYLNYKTKAFSKLNDENYKKEVLKIGSKILDIKNKENDSKFLNGAIRENAFIQALSLNIDKYRIKPIEIKIRNRKFSVVEKNNITDGFQALYDNKNTKELAEKLLEYSLLQSGFFTGFGSLSDYIPIEVLESIGYTQERKNQIREMNVSTILTSADKILIEDLLIRNFPKKFTKIYDVNNFDKSKDKTYTIKEKSKIEPIGKIKYETGENPVYPKYIRIYENKTAILLKLENNSSKTYKIISDLSKGTIKDINTIEIIEKGTERMLKEDSIDNSEYVFNEPNLSNEERELHDRFADYIDNSYANIEEAVNAMDTNEDYIYAIEQFEKNISQVVDSGIDESKVIENLINKKIETPIRLNDKTKISELIRNQDGSYTVVLLEGDSKDWKDNVLEFKILRNGRFQSMTFGLKELKKDYLENRFGKDVINKLLNLQELKPKVVDKNKNEIENIEEQYGKFCEG